MQTVRTCRVRRRLIFVSGPALHDDSSGQVRNQFETRSHARSLAATRRGFTFYAADPLRPIHEFRLTKLRSD
jgi:hypothetical protein